MSACLLGVVLSLSLLIHEYGHALAAIKCGREPQIILEAFGGYVSYPNRGLHEKYRFFITLCGPLFTALLIGVSYYFFKSHVFTSYWVNCFFYYMMKLNTYLLIVNLAPLPPLDGGQMAGYVLRRFFGEERGAFFGFLLGMVAALVGAVYFLAQQSVVFACVFLFYGMKNFQAYRSRPVKSKGNLFSQLNEAMGLLAGKELDMAQKSFRKLIRSNDESIRNRALEGLAEALQQQGKPKEAYDLLRTSDVSKLKEGKWLLCKLASQEKNYHLVAEYAHEIYELRPTFETALLNAKAYSSLQDIVLAEGWLHTASQFEEAKTVDLQEALK
ncbi:MAG: M50 family metallopeptidase [Chlamydiales bacterium]|nr:M50 family metallopeptidase [Chlamydiales bacterium]